MNVERRGSRPLPLALGPQAVPLMSSTDHGTAPQTLHKIIVLGKTPSLCKLVHISTMLKRVHFLLEIMIVHIICQLPGARVVESHGWFICLNLGINRTGRKGGFTAPSTAGAHQPRLSPVLSLCVHPPPQ
ncbi:hypothetical protein ElyMa_002205300 [Elysia marginata]|uniref:Uncharacterized protein n=1 Tax=Elysia marginata TaxID=1093978 RepID=A0AAV4FTW9_9GAST|nr:hypothetical protein ElyMa_002205300 [Elysia marginata]